MSPMDVIESFIPMPSLVALLRLLVSVMPLQSLSLMESTYIRLKYSATKVNSDVGRF